MTDFIDDIFANLSDEEKVVLEKIQDKLSSHIEQEQKIKREQLEAISESSVDFSEKNPELIHPKNLTRSPNELIFTIRGEASTINAKGELESISTIIEKFYHIPLKEKDEYQEYMNKFFDKFHSTLEETCKIINLDKQNEK